RFGGTGPGSATTAGRRARCSPTSPAPPSASCWTSAPGVPAGARSSASLLRDASGRDGLDSLPSREPSPDQAPITNETQARIDEAFAALAPDIRAAWELSESMPSADAGAILGLTVGGVGAFRHRVRNRLRRALAP